MDDKNKKIAEKLFKAIKKSLSDARKYNKENGFTDSLSWNRRRQQVDINIEEHSKYNGNTRTIEFYAIKIGRTEYGKVERYYNIDDIFKELNTLLTAQQKVKGWSGLNFFKEKVCVDSGSWRDYEVTIIPKVCLADAPCSEYKSLANFVNKYAQVKYGSKVNLGNFQLFSAAMGGKRGRLWDEHGERLFLDNKPKKCARLLEELRKNRGTKDAMICERGEENYIDPEEQRYSAYAEIECEGEKRKYLLITIKTPTGKVKYETKIY
jgi:hypothetical protein